MGNANVMSTNIQHPKHFHVGCYIQRIEKIKDGPLKASMTYERS